MGVKAHACPYDVEFCSLFKPLSPALFVMWLPIFGARAFELCVLLLCKEHGAHFLFL